eukprot:gb/GECG01008652.1/.p1 GENE.gb/GECG01008652.1/~~gb/GECG01008652.1/.p1  ORF type:complete len:445 (+),score=41.35 gb/GECG01008652.1/:1-1335(+)
MVADKLAKMKGGFRQNARRMWRRARSWWFVLPPAASAAAVGTSSATANPGAKPMLVAPTPPDVANKGFNGTVAKGSSISTYRANDLLEDRHLIQRDDKKLMAAVLDGHGGWQAAEFVKNNLWKAVLNELQHVPDSDNPRILGHVLTRAYERVDRMWMSSVRQAFDLGFGETARVGSCCVGALFTGSYIVVANSGDCRAVVAQRADSSGEHNQDQTYRAMNLSRDHNAKHIEEQEHLSKEHPGEQDVVLCRHPDSCYVKGRLQPTRSFGDLYLKYAEFNGVPGQRQYGRHISPPYTPPYITVSPEVRVHSIDREKDAFVILACDGVWDVLSSDEAVQFVVNDNGDRESVAARLTEHVLRKNAGAAKLSLDQLMQIPPGRGRRRLHDDITIVVVFLDTDAGEQICHGGIKEVEASWWNMLSGWLFSPPAPPEQGKRQKQDQQNPSR